ncbi:MAG TPA: MBL fold metallo-hydrolase [Spirochaetota bacterium]
MTIIFFLGTNGWYDSDTGNTISILIDAGEYVLVLDAGNGIAKLDRYLCGRSVPVYIFLSHLHLDHIEGLHTLDKNSFPKGCTIIGGIGVADSLGIIMRQPFTKPFSEMDFDIRIVELDESDDDSFPFGIDILPLKHSSSCFGARITINDKVISYVPDTGYCPNAVTLSRDADLLIAECAFLPGESDLSWPHLNPEVCALIANESGAKKLALVHFEARRYDSFEKRREAESVARNSFPESVASSDGMEIVLSE